MGQPSPRSSAPEDGQRYYSVAEAAQRLDITVDTAHRLLARDRFPTRAFKVGGVWRIPAAPLDELTGEA